MSEEIKEILETPIFMIDNDGFTVYINDEINNYITNLQKENENLKELCDKYEEEHNTAFKLWKANMEKIPPFDKFLDYKQRNEKAIESIEDCKKVNGDEHTCIIDHNYLLNILQGGDE